MNKTMFCPECGNEVTQGAKFCSNCGRALAANESSVSGTIQMRCKSCNGIMHAKEGENLLYCPYCGAEEMIVDSEDVAIEKIRYKAYADVEKHRQETTKQVELERMKHEREMEEHEDIKESSRQFKKSKLRKWVILFAILCAIITCSRMSDKNFVGALIPGIQTILFVASWVLGSGTSKKHWLHRVLAICGFLLIIPFIRYGSGGGSLSKTLSKLEWPASGLAAKLPRPESKYGEISINYDDLFVADVDRVSQEQYTDYLSQCKDIGFTVEGETSSIGYDAFNDEGYNLSLNYFEWEDGQMSITLRAPTEISDITWPDTGPGALLPTPTSLKGKIDSESSDKLYVHIGNTSREDFEKYIAECKKKGFTEDYSKTDDRYTANNPDGYKLSVEYEGFNIMEIYILAPQN